MIFILHRYIFREVFKVFALATVALTLMLSLGSILQPVQQYGVGPRQVVHFMVYSLPITLTFVLPMAALFAAALVYGRFASDNELDACRASGISLLALVYPGLALAIIVAIANLLLSFQVMPVFVQRAKKSLKADAKQILFRNIQRRGYYEMPSDEQYLIYADQANVENDTLSGIVIAEMKNNEIKNIITAESARVRFNPHEGFNEVQITAHNTHQMGTGDEGWFFVEGLVLRKEFGSLLGDDIKFKKIDEMKRIQADPMRFYPIAKMAGEAYAQLTAELLAQDIAEKITDGADGFYKLYSGEKFVEFTANNCSVQDEKKVELSGEVLVKEYDVDSKELLRTLRAARTSLHIEGDELAPTLTMDIRNPVWKRPDGSKGLAHRHIIRGLIIDKFATEDALEAVSVASTASVLRKGPSPELKALQNRLQRKIQKTMLGIKAEIHSRLVFGIGCVPLIMIGIGLGIVLKGGHLLTAFGASSVPAAILIVCIMMGKNVMKNLNAQAGSGVVLMWAGLAFLSLLAVGLYHRLLKN